MSGFNTKTPIMDWSSFMRRDFQKENGMGALADAFNVVADTADGYGETADKKLLSDLVNETDVSKIDNSAFYSKDNALKAKNLIETNKNLEYQEEQRNRANELNARNDAEYAINQFNKEAMGDAINMDKASFEAKYKNAGGLDWAMMYDTFNKKEDREFAREDREQKNRLTNLQIQNTQNSINNQIEERNYTKEQRDKKELDEQNLNNLVGKYNSWDEFKNSGDWNKPEYNYTVKKTFYDSFGKNQKETSLTDQIKLEEINNNKKDLPRIQEEYKKTYGTDMPISEQSKFVYKGELPEKLKPVDKKPLPIKEAGEYQALIKYEEVLNELEKAYHPSYVGGLDSSLNTISPNFILSDGHRKFNNLMNDVLLGKTSALTGTLSDRDMALLQSSGLSETLGEKDFLEKLRQTKEQVKNMKESNLSVLQSQYEIPDNFAIASDKKTETNQPKITSVRKNENITTSNQKTIIQTGITPDGKKVVKYSDGSIEYAN